MDDTDAERDTRLAEGVRALDHTADVGLAVTAPSLEALFDRAARGLLALLRGADVANGAERQAEPLEPAATPGADASARKAAAPAAQRIDAEAGDPAALLVAWLRELLWLYESQRFAYGGARFETLTETALAADVRGTTETRTPDREIKGVTYHGLDVRCNGDGWHARVIFDV
jgi:SHS2 domain-containing protein